MVIHLISIQLIDLYLLLAEHTLLLHLHDSNLFLVNQWNIPMLLRPKVRRVDLDMFYKSESMGSVEAKYSKSRKTVEEKDFCG